MENIHQFNANVKKRRVENKKFFAKIKKKRPKDLDNNINELHEEEMSKVDCLSCGNCCKTSETLLSRRDIVRISKYLGMKQGDFTDEYVKINVDDDYVLRKTHCTFLNEDNSCQIYDVRPNSCENFPYTDDHRVDLNIMEKNIAVCPAVYDMAERLKRIYIVLSKQY